MEKAELRVEGMRCNNCKKAIEGALKEIGVQGAADPATKIVRVEFDPKMTNIAQIKSVIEDAGFEAERQ
ncbi:MAG: cation transporter [Helicobacteraceae bacterium]|jgi:copper chaperone|nr:cation transporter [Helicobacteraceae bacterium]